MQEIYNQYKDSVFRICLGYVHNNEVAEDLTQDVFIKVLEHREKFKGNSAISTWIYRIAVNTCLASLRKKHIDTNELKVDPEHTDDDQVIEKRIALLQQCVQELNEVSKLIIGLYFEKLSTADIAEVMGLEEGAVRTRIHRIKKILTDKMKAYGSV